MELSVNYNDKSLDLSESDTHDRSLDTSESDTHDRSLDISESDTHDKSLDTSDSDTHDLSEATEESDKLLVISDKETIQINDSNIKQGFIKLNDGSIVLSINRSRDNNRITSLQDPYKIIDIMHHYVSKGRLTLSIAPGKKDTRWNRDLKLDLTMIKNNGIRVIVCLLEWSEMKKLHLLYYPKIAQEEGFIFYHLPIKDRGIPNRKNIDCLIPILVEHLISGQNVLIHCRSGLGRAGTVCACCLAHFGFEGQKTIDVVRDRRPGAIQTFRQESFVIRYCNSIYPQYV